MNTPEIPWLALLSENDTITTKLPYVEGTYYHLFEEGLFKTNDSLVGDLRYYVYDPTKHGYSKDKSYPVLYAFHGSSASLQGITAINWAGVEYFASPEYQEKMGGAYIICPLANEYMDGDFLRLSWMTAPDHASDTGISDYPDTFISSLKSSFGRNVERFLTLLGKNSIYTKHLYDLLNEVRSTFTSAGKTIVFGTSAGGYCAWRYIISYPVDAALIMAPAYLPSTKELEVLEQRKQRIWLCQGLHDECVPYEFSVAPILDKLTSMEQVELFLPAFVRMPDHGVYSNPAGIEMGQHCINNAVQCDLMYDDGKPMDPNHPEGVTGWIKSIR